MVAVLVLLLTIHGEELQAIVEDKTDTRRLLRTPTELSQRSLQILVTGACVRHVCVLFNPCADPNGAFYLSKTDTGCWLGLGKTYTCCPKGGSTTNQGTSGKLAY